MNYIAQGINELTGDKFFYPYRKPEPVKCTDCDRDAITKIVTVLGGKTYKEPYCTDCLLNLKKCANESGEVLIIETLTL